MYDWPEVADDLDRLWEEIHRLLAGSIPGLAPRLERPGSLLGHWRSPDLAISQTCSITVMDELRGQVEVLGSLVYDAYECAPGYYESVIVRRMDDAGDRLEDFHGRTVAFNDVGSYSGRGSLLAAAAEREIEPPLFERAIATGSHRASIVAVAEGRADVAAIDAMSWALAQEHEPRAASLTVIDTTTPVPAVPLIAGPALRPMRDALNRAIAAAVSALPPVHARRLHISGYVERTVVDYWEVADAHARAFEAGHRRLARLPNPAIG